MLGLDTGVRGKPEPLRGKLTELADRGWLHKRPDGKFTASADQAAQRRGVTIVRCWRDELIGPLAARARVWTAP
ncbi:hypothetical protein OOK27_47665 [Streptomyces canus]|uniref:hypothetical protein n=1 Tax=Streptomyces canus TaxID=58343 RepID=UPI00224DE047|nr:hypothetical protein [Streptomyces canus]MCX5261723.1 hypothetical protein [Streptomyces canus]